MGLGLGWRWGFERLHRPVRLLDFVTPRREGSDLTCVAGAPACLAVLLCCWRVLELAVLLAAWAWPCMRLFEGCLHPCVSAVCGDVFRRRLPLQRCRVFRMQLATCRTWLGLGASQSGGVYISCGYRTVRYIGADTHTRRVCGLRIPLALRAA